MSVAIPWRSGKVPRGAPRVTGGAIRPGRITSYNVCYTKLLRPGSYEFLQRQDLAGADESVDFNFRSLRGNAVLRWEWRPGSTLYLAWQQVRADYASSYNFV